MKKTIPLNSRKAGALVLFLALGLTAEVVNADFIWGTPSNLGPTVNSSADDSAPSISADGLQLYFIDWEVFRPGGYGLSDIWVTTRETTEDDWGTPVNLGPTVNSSYLDAMGSISADGLSFFFTSDRPGGLGSWDIYVTTRATKEDDWGTPVNLGPTVNSTAHDCLPDISADGLVLFFSDYLSGPYRPGGFGISDNWVTTRPTTDDPWGTPVNLGPPVNTSAEDLGPNISADGSTLFFSSRRPGGYGSGDIWQVPIIPVVDFNGDGIVDSADVCIMVDHWHTDYPLCDIAPAPFGDGIVDVQDMILLSEHLFEDYRMITHWMLDEEAGETAHDSAGNYNGTLNGEPLWQPEGGILDGALEFDGNDDYISTPFVLNPEEKSFSAFAWIQGGSPGQVIISQSDITGARGTIPGCTWLGINSSNGSLMTGLMDTAFGPLESDSFITDGQWHHIGLVYDLVTMRRHLYMDGAEVAADTDFIGGVQTTGGLYIGAGQALDASSFFSGLIDDVRVYNIALTAEEIAALVQ